MKKITLLLFILTISFGYSQSLPIDFDDTLDANFVPAGNNTFAVVMDGANNVGQTASGDAQYDSRVDLALDTYVDMTTASKTFTFEFYTSEAVVMTGLFQIGNKEAGGADVFPIEMQFTTDGNIGWQTITLDFTNADNGYPNCATCPSPQPVEYGQYAQVSVFTNFGDTGTSTYWFDDIAGAANGATVLGDPEPTTASPIPPSRNAADVVSMFSGSYTDIPSINWNPGWSGGISTLTTVQIQGDDVFKVVAGADVYFAGDASATTHMNLSNFEFMHFDYWTEDASVGQVLNPKLSQWDGGAGEAAGYNITNPIGDTSGLWVSVDIALTDFLNPTTGLYDVAQVVFQCNTNILYIDNIYFYKGTALSTNEFVTSDFSVYPNPSNNVWNVKSNNTVINSVQVFDVLGKQVLSLQPRSNNVSIDASELTKGLYFAKIESDTGISSIKLIKN